MSQMLLVRSVALKGAVKKLPSLSACLSVKNYATEAKPEDYGYYPDPIEHATGLEKKMLLAKLAGDDRYEPKVYKRGEGSKENPNLIPTHFESRMCGCICEPDQIHINYFWVKKGHPTRCECGYWFKAIEADPDSF